MIEDLKEFLIVKGNEIGLFGTGDLKKFILILKNLNSIENEVELYPYLEDKAANMLYMIIKSHPFVDGNKRIATYMFNVFLEWNNVEVVMHPLFATQIA